ncbi:unnamed protein product [Camellia sinensis]
MFSGVMGKRRDTYCFGNLSRETLGEEYGDIKPDNLLVTAAGTVKIGDFSVSQVFKIDDHEPCLIIFCVAWFVNLGANLALISTLETVKDSVGVRCAEVIESLFQMANAPPINELIDLKGKDTIKKMDAIEAVIIKLTMCQNTALMEVPQGTLPDSSNIFAADNLPPFK